MLSKIGVLLGIGLGLLVFLGGCGGGATAKLQFTKTSRDFFSAAEFVNPLRVLTEMRENATVFKMKLIAAYLTEDIDPVNFNNVGTTSMIYLNTLCADDIMHCDLSAGPSEDGGTMTHIITDFFDFSSTEAANAALNAQSRSITPATYKYARLEFCKYNAGNAENISWASTSPSVTEQSFKRNSCTVNSAVMDPPLVVAAGGSVTVNLSYTLVGAVSTAGGGDDCDGATTNCFTVPTFTPTATATRF